MRTQLEVKNILAWLQNCAFFERELTVFNLGLSRVLCHVDTGNEGGIFDQVPARLCVRA